MEYISWIAFSFHSWKLDYYDLILEEVNKEIFFSKYY